MVIDFFLNSNYPSLLKTRAYGECTADECAAPTEWNGSGAEGSAQAAVAASDYQEFDNNIHCFCQPDKGWRLYSKQEPPSFFVSVLTDIKVGCDKKMFI